MAPRLSKPRATASGRAKTPLPAATETESRKATKRPASDQGGASKTAKTTLLPAEPGKVKLTAAQPPNTPAEVTLASDCSGLCTEGPAVRVNLPSSVNVKHSYTSEIDSNFRSTSN